MGNYSADVVPWIVESDEPRPKHKRQRNSLTDLDRHIGSRIRLCRTTKGLSLQQLGDRVGITYQQAHKYERGHSRIPAGRLHAIAQALGIAPSWFFEGTNAQDDDGKLSPNERLCLEMSRSFATIGDDRILEAFARVVRVIAETAGSPGLHGRAGITPGSHHRNGAD